MDLTMFRGDTPTIKVTNLVDDVGQNPTLVGATAWLTVKKRFADTDANAQFSKRVTETVTADGRIVAAGLPDTHYVEFYLAAEDTDGVTSRNWRYDVQVKLANDKIFTVAEGKLNIVYDVTRATA